MRQQTLICVDAGLIKQASPTLAFYSNSGGSIDYLQGYITSEIIGMYVCISAKYTDTCGTITDTWVSDGNQTDFTETDIDTTGGDSGGLMYSGGSKRILGIHSTGEVGVGPVIPFSRYVQVGNIMSVMGVTPITITE